MQAGHLIVAKGGRAYSVPSGEGGKWATPSKKKSLRGHTRSRDYAESKGKKNGVSIYCQSGRGGNSLVSQMVLGLGGNALGVELRADLVNLEKEK